MMDKRLCHGRMSWAGRPPAGCEPWDWWWQTWAPLGVTIYVADIPEHATTHWSAQGAYVTFNYKLTALQRTASLAHEMHHLAIGGVCRTRCPQNEAKVKKATCRWLLPDIEKVANVLRSRAIGASAIHLGVPRFVIYDRLETATPTEQQILAQVFGKGSDYLEGAGAAQPAIAI